ncbi:MULTISPECIES: hypothetical protein [unclassified Microcoleus]|uniref:hypothetical protein n=1 Tax=unclassified Microcoleus TaxID=2642155 RepID=UPI002FD518CD
MAAAKSEQPGLTLNNTSLAVKLGLPLGNFFNDIGSTVQAWINKGFINLKNLAKNMIEGAKELAKAILRGDWNLFKSWLREDPIAVAAGMGAVILIGGVVVGGVVAGIGALAGAVGLGGVTLAGIGGTVIGAAVSFGTQVYDFDFNKSDAAILAEINAAFGGLANIAGEALGRSLAGFIANRKETPKLRIDINATATMFLALDDNGDNEIAEEILEELSSLGWAFYRFAQKALFAQGYMNFRQWVKRDLKSGIPWVDAMIRSWGEEGGKPWVIRQQVDQVVEQIQEDNAALGNFLEGALEGFGDGFKEFLELEYR